VQPHARSATIPGISAPAFADTSSNDERVNGGDSIFLHVRAHGRMEGCTIRTTLELETTVPGTEFAAVAWAGYDPKGNLARLSAHECGVRFQLLAADDPAPWRCAAGLTAIASGASAKNVNGMRSARFRMRASPLGREPVFWLPRGCYAQPR
jgi:hypothetical protein